MATITSKNISDDISIADSYWRLLCSLNDRVKLRLASMLTLSVAKKAERDETSDELTTRMLKKHCGAWTGDESSEEIMAAIRENSSIRDAIQL